jgi:hypothetical protein
MSRILGDRIFKKSDPGGEFLEIFPRLRPELFCINQERFSERRSGAFHCKAPECFMQIFICFSASGAMLFLGAGKTQALFVAVIYVEETMYRIRLSLGIHSQRGSPQARQFLSPESMSTINAAERKD